MWKNIVDKGHIQGLLDKKYYEVDSNLGDINVVALNFFSFIETAREEYVSKIV